MPSTLSRLTPFLCLLLSAPLFAQSAPSPAPTTVPSLPLPEVNNAILTELAAQVVILHDVPGLTVAVFDASGLRAVGSAGVRASGASVRIEPEDPVHIGSCGKAFTAALLLTLQTKGKLDLDKPLPQLLPGRTFDPAWNSITLADLLSHRSGLGGADLDYEQLPVLFLSATDPVGGRQRLADRLFATAPSGKRGSWMYSNCGYALAGYVAETVTKTPFEQLLKNELLTPLGITSAGFGAPGATTRPASPTSRPLPTAPWGHRGPNPMPPGIPADNPAPMSPAGTMHLSLRDWARFTSELLARNPTVLSKEAIARLTTPLPRQEGEPLYALGWGVTETRGRRTLLHAGSNTLWFAQVYLFPDDGWGLLVVTNRGDKPAQDACLEVIKELVALSGKPVK